MKFDVISVLAVEYPRYTFFNLTTSDIPRIHGPAIPPALFDISSFTKILRLIVLAVGESKPVNAEYVNVQLAADAKLLAKITVIVVLVTTAERPVLRRFTGTLCGRINAAFI